VTVAADDALAALRALADPAKAAEMAAYHKSTRPFLGVAVPQVEELVKDWRATCTQSERVALAGALWDSDIHEARIAAAKLLPQARIRDDGPVWALVRAWAEGFDGWSLADHASIAGQKRLVADPTRLADVAGWTVHPNMWTRRAALVMTLPWAKMNHPKLQDLEIRERVLGWAVMYVDDRDWFIQKAVAWWLRDLSKHDADRTRAFLAAYGDRMKPFARREAARHL
jgi:3-methyladenine DNA glycosylase AlkD